MLATACIAADLPAVVGPNQLMVNHASDNCLQRFFVIAREKSAATKRSDVAGASIPAVLVTAWLQDKHLICWQGVFQADPTRENLHA